MRLGAPVPGGDPLAEAAARNAEVVRSSARAVQESQTPRRKDVQSEGDDPRADPAAEVHLGGEPCGRHPDIVPPGTPQPMVRP